MTIQTTYSKRLSIVALALAMVSLSACSKENGETPVGRAGTPYNVSWAQQNGLVLNGAVRDNAGQDIFQDAVVGYLESVAAPEDVGYVSGTANGSGVFLGGRVELQSGNINSNGSNGNTQVSIRTDSKLIVAVYDEYTGQSDNTGKQIDPYSHVYSSATGYVRGNYAELKFTNEFGSVSIKGTFSGQYFHASFEYNNTRRWDGNNGSAAAGVIGTLDVPTCQFFRCQ